jgi:hypothetical protein
MGRRRWAGIAAVCAVAAGIVVALALLPGSDSPGVSMADAASRIEGESMRMRFAMGVVSSDGTFSASGEGVVSADNTRGELDMKLEMEGEPEPIEMRMRNIDDDFWYRMPQVDHMLPQGKRWIHEVDNVTPAQSLTPSEFAAFLAEADEVEKVGETEVRGQQTTHYRGMLDIEKLGDEIGGETKERLERAIEQADPEPGQKIGFPVEAWISEDGMPVRMSFKCGNAQESFDMTIDVLEYGVPVEVEPPPASKTIEQSEFEQLTAA